MAEIARLVKSGSQHTPMPPSFDFGEADVKSLSHCVSDTCKQTPVKDHSRHQQTQASSSGTAEAKSETTAEHSRGRSLSRIRRIRVD